LTALLISFFAAKAHYWAVPEFYALVDYDPWRYLERIFRQYLSPAHGMIACLPILLVLFWCPRPLWKDLAIKLAGILGVTAILAFLPFSDGGFNGGRYILPFLIGLLPEIAAGARQLIVRRPYVVWLVPVLVILFLPLAEYRADQLPGGISGSKQSCWPDTSPISTGWQFLLLEGHKERTVVYCVDHQIRTVPMQTAFPALAISRVAFVLSGGSSPRKYSDLISRLREVLGTFYVEDPLPWQILRATLATGLVMLSIVCAAFCLRAPQRGLRGADGAPVD
jgi:hypothetical protein